MNKIVQKVQQVVPGTNQVQLVPLVTMAMTVVAWVVVEYTPVKAPEAVWTAVTGLLIYAAQYWHGPRS